MKLKREFFNRNTVSVAKDLLGKYLVRKIDDQVIAAKIIETEAYHGPHDRASHASRGPAWPAGRWTPRAEVMFGPPGHAYIYLIYGMYHCLNISAGPKGFPAAVLIRSVALAGNPLSTDNRLAPAARRHLDARPLAKHQASGPAQRLAGASGQGNIIIIGPGRVCRELKIDRTMNGTDVIKSRELWFEDRGAAVPCRAIKSTPRIGVDYAGPWKDKPWRFVIKSNQ